MYEKETTTNNLSHLYAAVLVTHIINTRKQKRKKNGGFASPVSPSFLKRVSNNNPSLIFIVVEISFMSFRTTSFYLFIMIL